MKTFYEMLRIISQKSPDIVSGDMFIDQLKYVLSIVSSSRHGREFDDEASELISRMEDHYANGYISSKEEEQLFNKLESIFADYRIGQDNKNWYGI